MSLCGLKMVILEPCFYTWLLHYTSALFGFSLSTGLSSYDFVLPYAHTLWTTDILTVKDGTNVAFKNIFILMSLSV